MRDNGRAVRLRVGLNVRNLRISRGLSQERLAERAKRPHKYIGQVERGEINVTVNKLAAIAAALSVDISELFAGAAEIEPPSRLPVIDDRDIDLIERALRVVERLKQSGRTIARTSNS